MRFTRFLCSPNIHRLGVLIHSVGLAVSVLGLLAVAYRGWFGYATFDAFMIGYNAFFIRWNLRTYRVRTLEAL